MIFLILLTLISLTRPAPAQEFGTTALKECWKIETEGGRGLEIASDNVYGLFLSNSEGFMESIDRVNGKIIWKTEIGGELLSNALADDQKVYIISKNSMPESAGLQMTGAENVEGAESTESTEYTVRALSLKTGVTSWQKSLEGDGDIFFLQNPENLFFVTKSGSLFIISKTDGDVLLKKQYNFEISSVPFLEGDQLFLGTKTKTIQVISAENGMITDTLEVSGIPRSIFKNGTGNLFYGDTAGNIYSLDIKDSSVKWKIRAGAEIADIRRVKSGILVTSLDNYVYLLSEKSGKRIWKKRLSGRTHGAPLIKDNVAVFSTLGGTDAVFIELFKGRSVNQLNIREENYFTRNPKSSGEMIFFPTFKGILAYSAGSDCRNGKETAH